MAHAQFESCPYLVGVYQDHDQRTISLKQYLEGDYLIYEANFSQGGKAYIKVGSETSMGDSKTVTYCEGGRVTIRYHSNGVLDWDLKNQIYPSDVINEGAIYKMISEAKKLNQDLQFDHTVYDWTYLEGADLKMERSSELWFLNLTTSKIETFKDHSFQRLKLIDR